MPTAPTLKEAIAANNATPEPPAVVFSGHITGLAVVRSLGRRGVPTIVLDREPTGVAFASRHTTASGLVPNPQTEEGAFIERLIEVGEALERPGVLFPTNDDWLLAVLRHARRLAPLFHLPVSDLDTVDRLLDKTRFYEEVRRLGIALPESHVLTDENLEDVREALHYPVILKPAHQRPFYDAFGVKVFRVETPAELDRIWEKTRPHKVLVQEIVPSESATFLSLGSYVDRDGHMRGAFVGRKREQYPGAFGTACLVDTEDAQDIIDEGAKLLQKVGFHGVSELEYIHDARDGTSKIIDLNTRVWKWIGLPVAAGVDLPWLSYADAVGRSEEAPDAIGPSRQVRWIHAQDYVRLNAERSGTCDDPGDHLNEADWATLIAGKGDGTPRVVDAVFDADDPGPGARLVKNLFRPQAYYCPC